MKKIEFFKHSIDDKDIERVNAVLKSIFLATGKEVEEFERNFSLYTGKKYCELSPHSSAKILQKNFWL